MTLDNESYQLLQDSAAEWFAENASVQHFRTLRDRHGWVDSKGHWPAMADLGWAAILIDESCGGSGLGLREMGAVLEQVGRHLAPTPLISTAVMAVTVLGACRDSQRAQTRLQAIAQGRLLVAMAIDEGRHHNPARVATSAVHQGERWCLAGGKTQVADASGADALVVSARCRDDDTLGLFWVEKGQYEVQPLHCIDSRDHANVLLEDVCLPEDAVLARGATAERLLGLALDRGRIALSAEMLGCGWAAFWMTVEYLKIREQFGRLIGSYQALQHRAAKLYVELQLAQTVVDAALRAADAEDADLPAVASRAKSLAADTLNAVTSEALQLHGGIGMTDEHDTGLYLKRARVLEQLYGSAAYHRDRYASVRGF